jgi:hypothetical protein
MAFLNQIGSQILGDLLQPSRDRGDSRFRLPTGDLQPAVTTPLVPPGLLVQGPSSGPVTSADKPFLQGTELAPEGQEAIKRLFGLSISEDDPNKGAYFTYGMFERKEREWGLFGLVGIRTEPDGSRVSLAFVDTPRPRGSPSAGA